MRGFTVIAALSICFLPFFSCGDAVGPGDGIVPPGITFVSIPGGTFQMGDVEGVGNPIERPPHTVTVPSFEMSDREITNLQYARYLNEALLTGDIFASGFIVIGRTGDFEGQVYIFLAGTEETAYPGNRCWIVFSGGVFGVVPGHENWPVVYVTWYGAKAFARHYGFELPTESEWEYAGRGGVQNLYGTSDGTISPDLANYLASGIGRPAVTGSYPPNPFGLYDLTGNVWEWCHDLFEAYPGSPVPDPTGPFPRLTRVIRGGSWENTVDVVRLAYRSSSPPEFRFYALGFRVVRGAGVRF
jgi:formylglycine-generating enzyme required for sulfatase activity